MSLPTSNTQVLVVGQNWSQMYTLVSDDSILFDGTSNMVTLFVREQHPDMKDLPRGSAGGPAKFNGNTTYILYGGGGGGGNQE